MKTFLRVFLLFVAVDLVAVAQAPDNLAPQKHQVAGEGHYVRVNAHVYPDEDSIHITEAKMPTASESRKNDER